MVLGDDIVIADTDVANRYKELLSFFGVEVSLPKRILPTEGFSGLEFASQLFSNGEMISPLPIGEVLVGRITSLFGF